VFIAACSRSTQLPSTPTPVQQPTPAVTAAPVARLGVTIDSFGSQTAIQDLSEVTFDASGSSGTDLQFSLDFGDGHGADRQAVATHVYTGAANTYKARAIVTDSIGRTDSVSVDVIVKSIEGSWFSGIVNRANNRYEDRYLKFKLQGARSISGVYTHPEGNDTPFAGEFAGPRGFNITLTDGTIVFSTGADAGFDSTATNLTVHVRGGTANGQTLLFQKVYPAYGLP